VESENGAIPLTLSLVYNTVLALPCMCVINIKPTTVFICQYSEYLFLIKHMNNKLSVKTEWGSCDVGVRRQLTDVSIRHAAGQHNLQWRHSLLLISSIHSQWPKCRKCCQALISEQWKVSISSTVVLSAAGGNEGVYCIYSTSSGGSNVEKGQ